MRSSSPPEKPHAAEAVPHNSPSEVAGRLVYNKRLSWGLSWYFQFLWHCVTRSCADQAVAFQKLTPAPWKKGATRWSTFVKASLGRLTSTMAARSKPDITFSRRACQLCSPGAPTHRVTARHGLLQSLSVGSQVNCSALLSPADKKNK